MVYINKKKKPYYEYSKIQYNWIQSSKVHCVQKYSKILVLRITNITCILLKKRKIDI